MILSEDQIRQYQEDGYTVVPGLVSEAETAPVRKRLIEIRDGDHDWPDSHFRVMNPEEIKNKRGGMLPVGVQKPARQEAIFRTIADHPNLQSAMAQLLGGPVQRYTDQAIIKNKERDGQSFYHQDSFYWKLPPKQGCNAWIAFDNVDKNASALGILPKSQSSWQLIEHERYLDEPNHYRGGTKEVSPRLRIPTDQIDFRKEVMLPMSVGDAAFFTNYTWHRAEPNRSGNHLIAYAIAYQLSEGAAPGRS